MDKKLLRTLFLKMLGNIIPSREVTPGKYPNARNFWGDDSQAWMFTEGFAPVEISPPADKHLGQSFSLVNDGFAAFDQFIETLKSDPVLGGKVGNQTLEGSTEKLLRAFRNKAEVTDDEVSEAIQSEVGELKRSVKSWTSLAPVDFLVLENISELNVGKIVLRPTSSVYERVLAEFTERINQVEKYDEQQKQELKYQIGAAFFQAFNNVATCAEGTVEAESSRVQKLAAREVESSLNLLRCYTHLLFPRDHRVKMGLRGETSYILRPALGFSTSDPSWTFNFQSIGLLQPFVVSPERLELLRKKFALDVLSETLAKAEASRTKLERAVVTAIRWLGRGVTAFDLAEKVLHFAAASERLLMSDEENKSEIMDKFARRLAFLIRDDPSKRLELSSRAKDLYKIRNKVIHAGKIDVSEEDVIEMEVLTIQALVKMAQRLGDWTKHEHFIAWVEKQSFGVAASNG